MPNLLYKKATIHYTDQGDGPVVIFLHGFLEDLSMWEPITASLYPYHRVICLDLLGHGASENLGYIHTMEDQANMINHLLAWLNISNCTMIGHSMGGYIALAFGELFPKKLRGICLMNSTPLADTDEKKHNRDRGIEAVKYNTRTFIRVAIPALFSEGNRKRFSNEINEITEGALQMSPQGIIASLEGMKIRPERTHVLNDNNLSRLMILGNLDPVLSCKELNDLAVSLQVKTVVFDGGHMSHIENQKELKTNLEKYLEAALS